MRCGGARPDRPGHGRLAADRGRDDRGRGQPRRTGGRDGDRRRRQGGHAGVRRLSHARGVRRLAGGRVRGALCRPRASPWGAAGHPRHDGGDAGAQCTGAGRRLGRPAAGDARPRHHHGRIEDGLRPGSRRRARHARGQPPARARGGDRRRLDLPRRPRAAARRRPRCLHRRGDRLDPRDRRPRPGLVLRRVLRRRLLLPGREPQDPRGGAGPRLAAQAAPGRVFPHRRLRRSRPSSARSRSTTSTTQRPESSTRSQLRA